MQQPAPVVDPSGMSVMHSTAAGPVVLHERDAPGWNACPYCVLDRIWEVAKVVGDQVPGCASPDHVAARIVLGKPARA